MSAIALITRLRKEKVRLYRAGTRLMVEAPSGVITTEIRAELVHSKEQILAALSEESLEPMVEDPSLPEPLREIAGLLATAYLRQQAIRKVPVDHE